jgi:hypothetical protein
MNREFRAQVLSGGEVVHICMVAGFVALLLIPLVFDVLLARWMLSHDMSDFGKFYYTTRFFLERQDLYAQSPATLHAVSPGEWRQFTNMNPPHFHLLVIPFALWGPAVALAGWTTASLISLYLSVRIVVGNLGWFRLSPWRAGLVLFCGFAWVGTGSLIVTGQLSWLLLWPMTSSWSAMREGRWAKAGALLGFLASVKPFLLLLLVYFIIRRQRSAVFVSLAVFASAFLVGIAVFGSSAHSSWLRSLGGMNWPWAVMNGSLLGFLVRLLSPSPALEPLFRASDMIFLLWLPAALGGITLTVLSILRRPADGDRAFALLLLAALLFSPLGWVYYTWFLLPPLLAIAKRGLTPRQPALVVLAVVAGLWPVPLARVGQPSALATLTVGSVYFWGLLAIWIALLRDSPEPARDSGSARWSV